MVGCSASAHRPSGELKQSDIDAAVVVAGTPRVCRPMARDRAMCWGQPPRPGETGWLIAPRDRGGNRGKVRIGATEKHCFPSTAWTSELENLEQVNALADVDREPIGEKLRGLTEAEKLEVIAKIQERGKLEPWIVLDVEVGPSASRLDASSVVSPDGRTPWFAMHRDRGGGDDHVDFVVTTFACDDTGTEIATNPDHQGGTCLDYWIRSTGQWQKIRRDIDVPASCVE
jgi:hypothetical protein